MESRSNITSTVSLVCGIALWVCFFLGMCLGFVPFVGFLGILLIPVEWALALVGLLTGIIGYRASASMDGVGSVSGITGAVLTGVWLLMQLLAIAMVFLLVGGGVLLTVLLAVIGAAQ